MQLLTKLGAVSLIAGLGACVTTAGALDLRGSDTLESLTMSVISACGVGDTISYVGGEAAFGERAMGSPGDRSPVQQIAPMSRFLRQRACNVANGGINTAGSQDLAEGLGHSIDALTIVQARREGEPGPVTSSTAALDVDFDGVVDGNFALSNCSVAEADPATTYPGFGYGTQDGLCCDIDGDGQCKEGCPDINGDGMVDGSDEPSRWACRQRQNAQQECLGLAFTNELEVHPDPAPAGVPLACRNDSDCTDPDGDGIVDNYDSFCSRRIHDEALADAGLESPRACAKRRFFTVKDRNGASADGDGVAGHPDIECPGCEDLNGDGRELQYELADEFDGLRVLFGGLHRDGTADCNSDVRNTLADEWASATRRSCASGRCESLNHIWRQSDESQATDTFVTLTGIDSFCNGDSFEDNDPIRRPCLGTGAHTGERVDHFTGDQVCREDGTLGLLLPVVVPADPPVPRRFAYEDNACRSAADGNAAWPSGVAEFPADTTVCPDGLAPVVGATGALLGKPTCWVPTASANRYCLADRDDTNPAVAMGSYDGRAYNRYLWDRTTGLLRTDALGRHIVGAYYRVHTNAVAVNTRPNSGAGDADQRCRRADSDQQIGCLTQADPCSLGFSRPSGAEVGGTTNLKVKNVRPSVANIQNLVIEGVPAHRVYPLARVSWLNTMKGFENVDNVTFGAEERTLAECFADARLVKAAARNTGHVPLPGNRVLCNDFSEDRRCDGEPANVDACANNPAPFPNTDTPLFN
ncbi:MAG: hypothetical protein B7733_03935 [Myxococcales bacterium FL481]|nr:MAG: hypothetical protein B7733_03935 [Myxococcales bacterium FL481]